jgi:uncharacterized repeat protein (TIGR01451 family)
MIIGALSVIVFAAIVVSGLTKFKGAEGAGTPQFNYLQGDYEMLAGAKAGAAGWADPVPSINIGDEVALAFYYHNGVVGSTATNVKLRVDLNSTQANPVNMVSNLWSDQTTNITNTVVNGAVVGNSGMTINLPTGITGRAEYVPGSTKMYKNVNGQFTFDRNLADGITSSTGLNIGNVQGCWQYAGYVTLRVKIRGQALVLLDKKVALLGSSTYLDTTEAWAGDTMTYRVTIENNGTEAGTSVVLKDVKPSYMTYIAGSTKMYDYLNPTGVAKPDSLYTAGGLVLQDVPVDNSATASQDEGIIYVTYQLKIDTTLPGTDPVLGTCSVGYSLNNQATIYLNGVNTATDTARVLTRCHVYTLELLKQVKTGPTTWGKNSVANLGDTIDYKITVKSNGNSDLTNVDLRDVLPQYTQYVVGSTKVDGVAVNDNIITAGGINIGTLVPAQQKIITLQAVAYGCVPVGNYTVTNTAYGSADTITTEINDAATTIITFAAPIF